MLPPADGLRPLSSGSTRFCGGCRCTRARTQAQSHRVGIILLTLECPWIRTDCYPVFFFSHYIFLVWTQFEIKAAALFISGCLQVGSSQLGLGLHGSDEWTWSHLGPDQVPASWASCPQWRPEARTKTSHVALDPSEPFEEELDPHDDEAKKKNTLKPCEQVFSLINQANKTPWLLPQPWSSSSAPDTRIQHFYSLHGFLNVDS